MSPESRVGLITLKGVVYLESPQHISAEQLAGFFVGWSESPSGERLLELLHSSSHVVLAFDEEVDRVIGFVTAVSDDVLCAYIPLLEVLPEYQGRGVGTGLMRRMLDKLSHLYMIDLLCDKELQPFYARLGMVRSQGMMVRNYERQSGE